MTVPVRKPNRQEFVRVHPDENWRLETAVLELKEDREIYLVDPSLWNELPGEIVPKRLVTVMNRQGVVTIWPIRLPGADGRMDHWSESAMDAADLAKESWIRTVANMSLGAYEIFEATGEFPEPEWPENGFQALMEIAFKNHYIQTMGHPVVKRILGEI